MYVVDKTIYELLSDIHNSVSLGFEKYVQRKEDFITESILKDALGGFLLEGKNDNQKSGQSVKILELKDEESNKVQRAILFYKKNSKGVDEQLFNDVLMMRVFVNDLEEFLKLLETTTDVSQIWKGISRSVEYHFAEAKLCTASCNYPWKKSGKSNYRQMIKFYDIYRPRGGLCPVHWIYVKDRQYANKTKKFIPVHEGFNCWIIEDSNSLCEYYIDLGKVPEGDFRGWWIYGVGLIDYWKSIFGFIDNTCACGSENCHFGFAKVPIMYGGEVKNIPGILEDFVVLVVVENSSGKDSNQIPTDEFSEGMLTNLNQLMNYMYANIALYVTRLIVDRARQEGSDVYGEDREDIKVWLDERVLKVWKANGELTPKGKLFIEWMNILKNPTSISNQIDSTKTKTVIQRMSRKDTGRSWRSKR